MKPIRLLLLTLLFSANLNSQVFYDTVSVRSVGPGMMHYLVKAPAVPWNINILTVDLTNPSIGFESVKANDRLLGYETVRSMAARKSSPGHLPVGAINADFYSSGGVPTNIQIAQGEILIKPVSRPALGFAADNSPMIDVVAMAITASLDDTVITVHGVNATRATDQLILFNSYKGLTTGTNQYGREVMIRPISPWLANDTVVCVAESVEVSVGDIEIPQGWGILSGHGASDTISLSRIQKGDTVRLYQGIAPGPSQLKEMVGGNPVLVAGGIDVSPAAPREPRTAAGFSADSTMLYLVTVDGRQVGLSAGMTFVELAQFMIQIGVAEGVNLDGGGSTTMVIRDSVMNSPSDGTERSVSNGLLVISSAPAGSLSNITLSPKKSRIFRGDSRQFLALGVDEYGNPASFDPAQVRFSCDLQIGSIDSLTGVFTAADSAAQGSVRVQYGAWSDSAQVAVKLLGALHLSPASIVTDTVRTISFSVSSFDSDNIPRQFQLDAYQWSSTHPEFGIVSSSGIFSGLAEGTTEVIAQTTAPRGWLIQKPTSLALSETEFYMAIRMTDAGSNLLLAPAIVIADPTNGEDRVIVGQYRSAIVTTTYKENFVGPVKFLNIDNSLLDVLAPNDLEFRFAIAMKRSSGSAANVGLDQIILLPRPLLRILRNSAVYYITRFGSILVEGNKCVSLLSKTISSTVRYYFRDRLFTIGDRLELHPGFYNNLIIVPYENGEASALELESILTISPIMIWYKPRWALV